jgi:hypothetical protein
MKRTPFYYWLLPSPTGKPKRSSWRMTEEEAKAYAGAVKVEEGVEWRDLPESPDEFQHTNGWQNNKPPQH